MTQTEVLNLLLDALRMPCNYRNKTQFIKVQEAIKAGEEALAQQSNEQVEPVGLVSRAAHMDVIVVNLVREGINKHRARDLAEHFLKYTHPPVPTAQPDYEKAYLVWQEKTDWVQETAKPHELGMHRADVLKQRIEELSKE